MQNDTAIKNNSAVLITAIVLGGVFIFLVKDLFFFDEDIFIVNMQSAFMQQGWKRSLLVKQFFKAENFFFGNYPAGYHIMSVALHLCNSIIAVGVFKKLLSCCKISSGVFAERTVSYLFFLFFLISPVHSEPMSYILAQGVLLFSLFALLCILFFLKALAGKWNALFFSLLFFTFSLLCYEISWMLPFIVLSIAVLFHKTNTLPLQQAFKKALPFFVLLAVWFIIKVLFISDRLVADYGDVTLQNIDLIKMCRNCLILFIRNFSPPFQNTLYFIAATIVLCVALSAAMLRLFKKKRRVFLFSILLILLLVLSFLPAALFGIDSHDSESERYVYFSSVFAMMLFAVLVTEAIQNRQAVKASLVLFCFIYAVLLYKTINDYRVGGLFSKAYLNEIAKYSSGFKTVYTIYQPSQFKGALLLRALTRLPDKDKTGDHHTVLNEYMLYLYSNNKTDFVTFSSNEIVNPGALMKTILLPLDNCAGYFTEASQLLNKHGLEKNNMMIVAARNDSLYIFR